MKCYDVRQTNSGYQISPDVWKPSTLINKKKNICPTPDLYFVKIPFSADK